MLEKVHLCGTISGRDVKNKLGKIGLTVTKGRSLNVPIIVNCIAFLECELWKNVEAGDHNLIIGKVVEAYVKDKLFDERYDISKVNLIYHCGGNLYTRLIGETIEI